MGKRKKRIKTKNVKFSGTFNYKPPIFKSCNRLNENDGVHSLIIIIIATVMPC